MGIDVIAEYVAGFAFGLLIFQALFMKDMLGGSYPRAVRRTLLPEWLLMNAVMGGMIPVMVILMSRDMRATEPASPLFWASMSAAALAGAVVAYPVNWWLVAKGLKHGMGTERALGKGDEAIVHPGTKKSHREQQAPAPRPEHVEAASQHRGHPGTPVTQREKVLVSLLAIGLLCTGALIGWRYGDLSMRPHSGHSLNRPTSGREQYDKQNNRTALAEPVRRHCSVISI